MMKRFVSAALVVGCLGLASQAQASLFTLDCSVTPGVCTGGTTVVDGSNTFYSFAGALWSTTDIQPTGTGVIDPFVRIQSNNDVESGMNTVARPLPLDENSSPQYTRDIQTGNAAIVTIAGVQYLEFLLDINQQDVNPILSLGRVEACYSATGSRTITSTDTTCAGTNFYSLDAGLAAGDDRNVKLNYSFNSGSGSGDLFMYLPVPAGLQQSSFLYLYSEFGAPPGQGVNNDGFEEWATRGTGGIPPPPPPPPPPVPEASLMVLFGMGLLFGAPRLRK